MEMMSFVQLESDRTIHKELNDTKFYIVWSLLVSTIFENVKWHEMFGIALEK